MRSLVLASVLAPLFASVFGAACSGNNCLRAAPRVATGRNGTADCLSFFRVTVTPLPSTIRSTITTTTAVPAAYKRWSLAVAGRDVGEIHGFQDLNGDLAAAPLQHRQVTQSPSAIPSHASACSSMAAYSSACSCIGASHATITAAGSTITIVFTIAKTVASTPLPTKVVDTPSSISSTSSLGSPTASSLATTTPTPSVTPPTNSTLPPYTANSTTLYTDSTTPTMSPTLVLDTSCGETSTAFQLQVSQPEPPGPFNFNNWYAHLSGDGVLFTSDASTATSFGIERSHHLCAVGYTGVVAGWESCGGVGGRLRAS